MLQILLQSQIWNGDWGLAWYLWVTFLLRVPSRARRAAKTRKPHLRCKVHGELLGEPEAGRALLHAAEGSRGRGNPAGSRAFRQRFAYRKDLIRFIEKGSSALGCREPIAGRGRPADCPRRDRMPQDGTSRLEFSGPRTAMAKTLLGRERSFTSFPSFTWEFPQTR